MIRLEGVSKRFGAIEALAPLDLEIPSGEWLGVFGRNGSGKTSLLRILVGLSRPTTGKVLLHGQPPHAEDWRAVRRTLGFMPERIAFAEHLTGQRTLQYFARLKGADLATVDRLLERVGLCDAAARPVGTYSKGMRQRLNFAQALLGEPTILIVDEPIEGLDAHGVREFFQLLREVTNRTVVIASHRLPLITHFVDRVCVLNQGRVTALGSEAELHQRLDLPVRLIVRPSSQDAAGLVDALGRLPGASVSSRNGRIVVSLAQRDKLRALAGLESLAGSIQDVRIEEPTLEEVLLETS
jgi:Cu-processing system ATP-binding protein